MLSTFYYRILHVISSIISDLWFVQSNTQQLHFHTFFLDICYILKLFCWAMQRCFEFGGGLFFAWVFFFLIPRVLVLDYFLHLSLKMPLFFLCISVSLLVTFLLTISFP